MSDVSVPDLKTFGATSDPDAKFFAFLGLLVSLAGSLEQDEFLIFQRGSRLPEDQAAREFYVDAKGRKARPRTRAERGRIAVAAMDKWLASDAGLAAEWAKLSSRLSAQPIRDARNLISHNPAVRRLVPRFQGLLALTNHVPEFRVEENSVEVRWTGRTHLEVDLAGLQATCEQLASLHTDIEAFLKLIP